MGRSREERVGMNGGGGKLMSREEWEGAGRRNERSGAEKGIKGRE